VKQIKYFPISLAFSGIFMMLLVGCSSVSRISKDYSLDTDDAEKKESVLIFYSDFYPGQEFKSFFIELKNLDKDSKHTIDGRPGIVFLPKSEAVQECMVVSMKPGNWDIYAHKFTMGNSDFSQFSYIHHIFNLENRKIHWLGKVVSHKGKLTVEKSDEDRKKCLNEAKVKYVNLHTEDVVDAPFVTKTSAELEKEKKK
jgi:hypothetical protein